MTEQKEEMIIDAENAVLGRLASYVAKKVLGGEKVIIVNSEKAIVVGREKNILEKYKRKRARGGIGLAGPYFPVQTEKILKRTIRNMLPYKQARGRDALKRVKCFNGIPKEYEGRKMIKSSGKRKGIILEHISKILGGK